MKKLMDKHTFGGSKASETLAIMLNTKYPKLISKIGAYYHKYTTDLTRMENATELFKDSCLLELMELHRDKRLNTVKSSSLPEELKSYLMNVMWASYSVKLAIIKKRLGIK